MNFRDLPDSSRDVAKFGDEAFWQDRYGRSCSSFEWFVSLKDAMSQSAPLKALLESRNKNCRILEIGCGTSEVCEQLWDLGFRDITGLDYNANAIAFCQERQGDRKIKFLVGDMTALPFENQTFDVIFDKGALDALVCAGEKKLEKCAGELWRVLKPDPKSVVICLSNAPLTEIPDGMGAYFEKSTLTLIKNQNVGQFLAKLYLFGRKKKPATKAK